MTPRKRQPPPIVDENPPRQPPPDYGTSGGVSLTDEVVERAAREAEQGYPVERLRPRRDRPEEDLMTAVAGAESPDEAARVISGLVGLRRKRVDPMADYVPDGTRLLRFVKEAVAHEAALTNRTVQEILRDALLGTRPLSKDLLDAHYASLYEEERK